MIKIILLVGLLTVALFALSGCTQPLCVGEGDSIGIMVPTEPECCAGLENIGPKEPGEPGIIGYCTANCGNGVCNGEIETAYNCPEDCEVIEPPVCGDGTCDIDEMESCPEDCLQLTELQEKAQDFCGQENIAGVFTCGKHIRVMSSLEGEGSTYYALDESGSAVQAAQCPIVAADEMSELCMELVLESTCVEDEIC